MSKMVSLTPPTGLGVKEAPQFFALVIIIKAT